MNRGGLRGCPLATNHARGVTGENPDKYRDPNYVCNPTLFIASYVRQLCFISIDIVHLLDIDLSKVLVGKKLSGKRIVNKPKPNSISIFRIILAETPFILIGLPCASVAVICNFCYSIPKTETHFLKEFFKKNINFLPQLTCVQIRNTHQHF